MAEADALVAVGQACQLTSAALLSSIWEGALLAGCTAMMLRFAPRAAASVRAAAWAAVLLLSALLPFLSWWAAAPGATQRLGGAKIFIDPRWSLGVVGAWAVCSLGRAGLLLASAYHLRKIRLRASPVTPGLLALPRLAPFSQRAANLCTSNEVQRPCVIGFLSPSILIPGALYGRLSATELEQIVLHELQHLRRRDDWINLLQKIGLVLFPLNPVLLWVERRLCLERELACDEAVLRVTRSPKVYASCLVDLAEQQSFGQQLSLALGAWGRRCELTRRVQDILAMPLESMGSRKSTAGVTSVLVLGLVAGAVALSRSPQLVSFSVPASSAAASLTRSSYAPVEGRSPYGNVVFGDSGRSRARLVKVASSLPSASRMQAAAVPGTMGGTRHPHAATPHERTPAKLLRTSRAVAEGERRGLRRQPAAFSIFATTLRFSSYAAVPTEGGWLIVQL